MDVNNTQCIQGMYARGSWFCRCNVIIEAVGNVLDLFNENAADEMFVSVNQKTNEIVVADNGYGMPLEKLKILYGSAPY